MNKGKERNYVSAIEILKDAVKLLGKVLMELISLFSFVCMILFYDIFNRFGQRTDFITIDFSKGFAIIRWVCLKI